MRRTEIVLPAPASIDNLQKLEPIVGALVTYHPEDRTVRVAVASPDGDADHQAKVDALTARLRAALDTHDGRPSDDVGARLQRQSRLQDVRVNRPKTIAALAAALVDMIDELGL